MAHVLGDSTAEVDKGSGGPRITDCMREREKKDEHSWSVGSNFSFVSKSKDYRPILNMATFSVRRVARPQASMVWHPREVRRWGFQIVQTRSSFM
jgi:hypothetical protein